MILVRRAIVTGAVAMALTPRRVYAFDKAQHVNNSYDKIREQVSKNMMKDTAAVREQNKLQLKTWDASEGFEEFIDSCDDDNILNELSYMMTMYDVPLKTYQRVYVSRSLLRLLESANSPEEAQFITNVMKYYGLYTDTTD